MSESARAGRRRRLPGGLLGALVMVVVVERFVIGLGPTYTDPTVWGGRFARWAAGRKAPGCEVLCFGDSLVKSGVAPRLIEARTGARVYSLAVAGGQAPASYFLLRRALAAGARPGVVVVDFEINLLAMDYHSNAGMWADVASLGDCLDLAWTTRDADLLASTVLAKVSPTVRARLEVRKAVRTALNGGQGGWRGINRVLRRNWDRNKGSITLPGTVGEPALAADLFGGWFLDQPCDRVNARYARRFLRLAESYGAQVILLVPPLSPALQAKRVQSGFDARYTRVVRGLQARFPNLIVADGRRSGYDGGVHHDAIHLDRRGAAAYSAAVAGLVGPCLHDRWSVPRWSDLPPYQETPADGLLEDLDQSKLALAARGRALR